jgi:D-cysteine desulfhydrase
MSSFQLPKKLSFIHAATPILALPRFSQQLGVQLFVKREDRTGFEWSGNKIRKLEFLFKEAQDKQATCIVTCGGVQSNHCRATAVLAAQMGLRCILLLRGEEPKQWQGNFLLDQLFGAEVHYLSDQQYYEGMGQIKSNIDSQVRATGGRSYFIPEGGSNALGSLGYLSVWDEIGQQLGHDGVPDSFDSIVVAHGSGGTVAGLTLGKIARAQELPALARTRVVGVNVCYDEAKSRELVKVILWQAIQGFQMQLSFFHDDYEILDGFLGQGYAKYTDDELAFYASVARTEGMLLDPVYTGKAFRALVETVKAKPQSLGKKILFIHTGGAFGDFSVDWKAALSK